MEVISQVVDLFLNIDVYLEQAVEQFGPLIYLILFSVIFAETGLVIMPFLPGDSLLFAAGALAAVSGGGLNIWILYIVLFTAAVVGDAVNYSIGRRYGRGILDSGRFSRIITEEHLAETEAFFARHGGKTISFARFFPFVRTFAPFIAGVGHMSRVRFTAFNVAGAAAWVGLFVTAGYFFGNIPFVEQNLEYILIGVILVSVAPGFVHWVKGKFTKSPPAEEPVPVEEPADAG